MTCTVICPLSGNKGAERALPSAFDAAQLMGSSLEFFSAVEDVHMVGRRTADLEQLGAQRRPSGETAPYVEVVVDPHAPRAIAERLAAPHVIAVMATSTQPFMHIGYAGSAAERATRDALQPSVLIGPRNTTRLCDVDRVVVACDGSKLSEAAIAPGRMWADLLRVDLWLVTSLPPIETKKPGYDVSTETSYLRRLAMQHGAQWEVLHGPDPAKSIAEWAGDALIAVTTHGRSGLDRVTSGSVTTAITRRASGPVLVANSRAATSA